MEDRVLKVLLLEDMRTDQELVKRQVLKVAPKSMFTIADSRDSFYEKITWMKPDIVIADYNLPDINGLEALLHIRKTLPTVPFIFVTGALSNEEEAANAILQGASGFILKEHLPALPDKLQEILLLSTQEHQVLQEQLEREQANKILLQKAYQLLQQSEDFTNKHIVMEALAQIQVNLGLQN
ncbi:MAG: response regulator [Bacteroidota bacterium]